MYLAKPTKTTLSKEKKKTWDAFSKMVRVRDEGFGCCTCGKWYPWKTMQAGHFIPGRHNAVLFDERNVHGQCYICNIVHKGQGPKYYQFMLRRYGQAVIDELMELDRKVRQFTIPELQMMRQDFISRAVAT